MQTGQATSTSIQFWVSDLILESVVSWSLKKQSMVSLSSTEAEYIAQTHVVKEVIWLRSFMSKICGNEQTALMISCDNQGAIALAKDNKFHLRTKHIDLWYHFIHEAVEDGKIMVKYIYLQTRKSPTYSPKCCQS